MEVELSEKVLRLCRTCTRIEETLPVNLVAGFARLLRLTVDRAAVAVAREQAVAPLTRTTQSGEILRRPARIEAEIAAVLALSQEEILSRATAEAMSEGRLSEECMVHLIRRDLRIGDATRQGRRLTEELMPILLERCDATLKRSIRGFPPSAASDVREEVLGRLAVSLAGPGDEADFLEVRFALALKRLRIDACRRERRRLKGLVALDDVSAGGRDDPEPAPADLAPTSLPSQEDRLLIRQALASLTAEERKIVVLHKLAGVPLASKVDTGATLVGLLGRSERTLRNRLRSAEAKLLGLRQNPAGERQEVRR